MIKPGISVVINTLNEEHNIAACIESIQDIADEVIVCDMYSNDRTVEIAKSMGARVVYHEGTGSVAPPRQYACEQATHAWILVVDADERVTEELKAEIRALGLRGPDSSAQADVYRIPIRDWMFGKFVNYGSWPHQRSERLYRKGYVTWHNVVHDQPEVQGRIGQLSNPLLHYSHTTIGRFLYKLNRYTEQEAQDLFEQGVRISLPRALLGAIRAFLGQYVRLQGFRDAGHGLILAVLMAFYYFTTRAKLWSLWYMHAHPNENDA